MRRTLRLDFVHACSILILLLLGLGAEVRADSIRWKFLDEKPINEDLNQVDWIDLKELPLLPHADQNVIIWSNVDRPIKPKIPLNRVTWEVLPETEWNLSDEEIAEQAPKSLIQPVTNPTYPIQALDRSIAFRDGFVGPDFSLHIPNGFRWSERWTGSASLRRQNWRRNTESSYQLNGGEIDYIVHANILQTSNWSFGLNTSVRSANYAQSGTDRYFEFGDGISSGFRIAKSLGDTAGIAFGGEQVVQWDNKTNTGRNLYLMISKGWWLSNQGNDYPLLIANGGLGTGSYANSDINATWTNPLRFACFENVANRRRTLSVDNDLCWSPIGSVSIIFNDYLSSFIEYRSGTASVAGSISLTDGIPIRLTWGVDFVQLNQIAEPDKLRWFFRTSIGF